MIGVIYETEEEKTEPKAREIMTGFASFFGSRSFGKNKKTSRRDLLASRREAGGKSGISSKKKQNPIQTKKPMQEAKAAWPSILCKKNRHPAAPSRCRLFLCVDARRRLCVDACKVSLRDDFVLCRRSRRASAASDYKNAAQRTGESRQPSAVCC